MLIEFPYRSRSVISRGWSIRRDVRREIAGEKITSRKRSSDGASIPTKERQLIITICIRVSRDRCRASDVYRETRRRRRRHRRRRERRGRERARREQGAGENNNHWHLVVN